MDKDSSNSFLSPFQRRLGAVAVACASALVILAFAGAMLWLLGRFVATFSPALWPLVIAALLSFLLQPVCVWLERRLRLPRTAAISVLYLAILGVCAALALAILPVFFKQLTAFIGILPSLLEKAAAYVVAHLADIAPAPDTDVGDAAASQSVTAVLLDNAKSLAGVSLPALAKAGGQVQTFFAKTAGLAIIPVYLFYLLDMRRDFFADLHRESTFLPVAWRDDVTFLARQFTDILVSYFRGQLLIGLILGVLLAFGFTLAGLKFGLLLGLIIGLLNVVPYLGTMLGLGVTLPLAFFQQPGGGTGTLIAVVVVFVVVQLLEGYWLTPKIMGKTTGLHPMAIIFSVFFWGLALDGLLGMVLAVPLTAFFVVFWRLLKTKYLEKPAAA
ncbi:MAG: AI-2E family transporter [Puniceicoccales bacterium]|jgi:predicted PurR-regulated permease PerM|nr:AI-2E family transporter [Puniceicoccales bacterium]